MSTAIVAARDFVHVSVPVGHLKMTTRKRTEPVHTVKRNPDQAIHYLRLEPRKQVCYLVRLATTRPKLLAEVMIQVHSLQRIHLMIPDGRRRVAALAKKKEHMKQVRATDACRKRFGLPPLVRTRAKAKAKVVLPAPRLQIKDGPAKMN